jgi:hypothetical protein
MLSSSVEGRPGHLRVIAAPRKRGRSRRHQWMDHPDRKPRCTAGLRQRRVSTALYGLCVCHFAVYSRCGPVSFRKEDDLRSPVVHPTGGSLRVFRHFAWLGVGSVKVALSRPTHQRVTLAVTRIPRTLEGKVLNADTISTKNFLELVFF